MRREQRTRATLWKLTRGRVVRYSVAFVMLIVLFLIAERGYFSASRPVSEAGGTALSLGPQESVIAGRLYIDGTRLEHGPLVVVLHGDAPFRNPGYQYAFASAVAKAMPGVAVAGLLRPGFSDPYGARSDGDRGFSTGDNYNQRAIVELGNAIALLKQQQGTSHLMLVGHSGGSVMAANIAARFPMLVDQLVLVSCPCNLPAFRKHMAMKQWSPLWLLPTRSVSPLDTVGDIQSTTAILAISGADDPIALPSYARTYIEAAKVHGLNAEMTLLPKRGHEILNDPEVLKMVEARVASLEKEPQHDVAATTPPPPTNDTRSCLEAVGAQESRKLVSECLKVSPATHPPCNAQNACSLIKDEIRRGCGMIGQGAPAFCAEYH